MPSLSNTINPRWMYLSVQALLSHRLKPALLEGGKVEQLLDWVAQQKDDGLAKAPSSDPGLDESSTLSSTGLTTSSSEQSDEEDDEEDNGVLQHFQGWGAGAMTPAPKKPWKESEIRRMIKLRAQGLTHMQTAVCFFASPRCPHLLQPPSLNKFG